MYIELRETDEFSEWLSGLRDQRAKARILIGIDRLAMGNPGDAGPVGDGISELRFHFGPGYRVYYIQRSPALIRLPYGGDKDSQDKDIAKARELNKAYPE